MTIVETAGGAVRGLDHGDHLAFLGVPWTPYRLGDRSTMAFAENPRVVADGFTRAPHELT